VASCRGHLVPGGSASHPGDARHGGLVPQAPSRPASEVRLQASGHTSSARSAGRVECPRARRGAGRGPPSCRASSPAGRGEASAGCVPRRSVRRRPDRALIDRLASVGDGCHVVARVARLWHRDSRRREHRDPKRRPLRTTSDGRRVVAEGGFVAQGGCISRRDLSLSAPAGHTPPPGGRATLNLMQSRGADIRKLPRGAGRKLRRAKRGGSVP
jgi:hypothetical protein